MMTTIAPELRCARRALRIARTDLWLAKVRMLKAAREVETLLYPKPNPLTSKQAG